MPTTKSSASKSTGAKKTKGAFILTLPTKSKDHYLADKSKQNKAQKKKLNKV